MPDGPGDGKAASAAGINAGLSHGAQCSPEVGAPQSSCRVWIAPVFAGMPAAGAAAKTSQQGVSNRTSVTASAVLMARTRRWPLRLRNDIGPELPVDDSTLSTNSQVNYGLKLLKKHDADQKWSFLLHGAMSPCMLWLAHARAGNAPRIRIETDFFI